MQINQEAKEQKKCYIGIAQVLSAAVLVMVLAACGGQSEKVSEDATPTNPGEVNVYSHRHYESDEALFAQFTERTGIKVNVVKANADQLIERLMAEGENSPADLLVTVDAGRLTRAVEAGLLQPLGMDEVLASVPAHLRDSAGRWVGLTKRARVIVYHKERGAADVPKNYEDLNAPVYKGRVVTRSSHNIYNQSWIASMIAANGEEAAEQWARGLVQNFPRDPVGGDRDQMLAVAAGAADFAVVNTYYLGLMSVGKPEEQAAAQSLAILFPNQDNRGTHINVSGIGITTSSRNTENARKLIRFLLEPESQALFARVNYEYPVLPGVPASEWLASWGEFKEDRASLEIIGKLGPDAVRLADRAGWK